MTFTSTVPAAVAALESKMQAVADAHPELAPGVYVGEILGLVENNFLAIGDPMGQGGMVTSYVSAMDNIKGGADSETYSIEGTIRTFNEAVDPVARLTDAFTLLNALTAELEADFNGSGALGSGYWNLAQAENPVAGKLDGRGFGVILRFVVTVSDVYL